MSAGITEYHVDSLLMIPEETSFSFQPISLFLEITMMGLVTPSIRNQSIMLGIFNISQSPIMTFKTSKTCLLHQTVSSSEFFIITLADYYWCAMESPESLSILNIMLLSIGSELLICNPRLPGLWWATKGTSCTWFTSDTSHSIRTCGSWSDWWWYIFY